MKSEEIRKKFLDFFEKRGHPSTITVRRRRNLLATGREVVSLLL